MTRAPADPRVLAVTADAVRSLRHDVLRVGRPIAESVYPQDEDATTTHLAVFVDDDLRCCVTVFPEPYLGEPAWRLRGMATQPDARGRGYASLLVMEVVRRAADAGVLTVWCNARTSALGFYQRAGFALVGSEFLTEAGVPHRVAVHRLIVR